MTRRMIACIVVVVAVAAMVSAETVNTSYPTIQFSYPEDVKIVDRTLIDENNVQYDVNKQPAGPYNMTYNFTVINENPLNAGNHTITVTAEDVVENDRSDSREFTVDLPFTIELLQPELAAVQNAPYDVKIRTSNKAQCAYSDTADTNYYYACIEQGNCFNSEGYSNIHTLSDVEFEGEKTFVCEDGNGSEHQEQFTFIIDDTAPEVNVAAIPNPVIDPGNPETTLNITTDDTTVCDVSRSPGFDDVPVDYEPPANAADYADRHQYLDTLDETSHTYDVTCENKVGLSGSDDVQVDTEYGNIPIVEEEPGTYASETFDLVISTPNIQTSCEYTNGSSWKDFQNTDSTTHSTQIGPLDEDSYTYTVRCSAFDFEETEDIDFTVETEPPANVSVETTDDGYCPGESPAFSFGYEDTTTVTVSYSVSGEQQLYSYEEEALSSHEPDRTWEPGQYSVNANFTDAAGNRNDDQTSFTVHEEQDIACDENAPRIETESDYVNDELKEFDISCDDEEGNCRSTFNFSKVDLSSDTTPTCQEAEQSSQSLTSNITVPAGWRGCFWVHDQAGNSDFEQQYVEERAMILLNPTHGVSPTPQYDVVLNTTTKSSCQYSQIDVDYGEGQWFDGEDENTEQVQHSIEGRSWDQEQIWFTCKDTEEAVSTESYMFRVDETDPSINVTARPNPVRDPLNTETELVVEASEPVVCNVTGDAEKQMGKPMIEETFDTRQNTTVTYGEERGESNDYSYTVTCQDKAERTVAEEQNVAVDVSDEFTVTVNNPAGEYLDTSEVFLQVDTQISTACSYCQGGDCTCEPRSSCNSLPPSRGTSHGRQLGENGLDDGSYRYNIYCDSTTKSSNTEASFTVDTTRPSDVAVDTKTTFCPGEDAEATLQFDDATPVAFTVSLKDQEGTVVFGYSGMSTTMEPPTVAPSGLEPGEYSWQFNVSDSAGNKETAGRDITIKASSSLFCDEEPPEIRVSPRYEQSDTILYNVTECIDDNCRSGYTYVKQDPGKNCPEPGEAREKGSRDTLLTGRSGTKVCLWVQDQNDRYSNPWSDIVYEQRIRLDQPRFGVAQSSGYTVSVNTTANATCGYADTPQESGIGTEFDETGTATTHRENSVSWEGEQYIYCETPAGARYVETFNFTIDAQPPTVDAGVAPDPLTNRSDPFANITIDPDEPVVCSIGGSYLAGEEPEDPMSYSDGQRVIEESHVERLYEEPRELDYTVQCLDRAGHSYQETLSLQVNFTNGFYIDFLEPARYTDTDSPTLRVDTKAPTMCQFEGDNMSNEEQAIHAVGLNRAPGTYTATVHCFAGANEGNSTHTFTVDTDTPSVNINSSESDYCRDDLIRADMAYGDTTTDVAVELELIDTVGNVVVNETVTDAQERILSEAERAELQQGEYTWKAQASDQADNTNTDAASFSFHNHSDLFCDDQPPQIDVTAEFTEDASAKRYDVDCTDNLACKDGFTYATPDSGSCSEASRQSGSDTVTAQLNTTVCLWVGDEKGLTDHYNETVPAVAFSLQQPSCGVSNTSTYNIRASTSYPAFCSYPNRVIGNDPDVRPYFDGESPSQGENRYRESHTVSNVSFDDTSRNLACETRAGAVTSRPTEFTVDTTEPTFTTASASPETVTDFAQRNTTLTIATDDKTTCTLDGEPIEGEQSAICGSYTHNRQVTIAYADIRDTEEHEFTYAIACTNTAGETVTTEIPVTVDLTSDFTIDITEPADLTSADPVRLRVDTGITTWCSYENRTGGGGPMSDDEGASVHEEQLSLEENGAGGYYEYTVECESIDASKSTQHRFIVDRTQPNLTVSTDTACVGGEPVMDVTGADTNGIKHFTHALLRDGSVVANGSTDSAQGEGQSNVQLRIPEHQYNDTAYTWRVTAVDNAGNNRTYQEDITVKDAGQAVCDNTPPEIDLDTEEDSDGTLVTVACSDEGSGCVQEYNYSLVDTGASCNSPTDTLPVSDDLQVPYNSKACFWVYDQGGNPASDSVTVGAEAADCGNNQIEPGELCDGTATGEQTCQRLGYDGGELNCEPGCDEFDASACETVTPPPEHECGDGQVTGNESCDPQSSIEKTCNDFDGYIGDNTVSCTDSCTFDTSMCEEQPGQAVCGDGTIQGPETCDGSNLDGLSCSDIGDFTGGTLGCNPPDSGNACRLDTSGCIRNTTTEAVCGDGNRDPGEECDGADLGGLTCADVTSKDAGTLSCSDCEFDTSACEGPEGNVTCGNGEAEGEESCDGDDLRGYTCERLGYGGGSLGCSDCSFDTSACEAEGPAATCGDGTIQAGESCENGKFGNVSCKSFDYSRGSLSCNECDISTSSCEEAVDEEPEGGGPGSSSCGNGNVDDGEDCDGTQMDGVVWCEDVDMRGGRVTCSDCSYDTSSCTEAGGGEGCPQPPCGEKPAPTDDGWSIIGLVFLISGLLSMMSGGGYLGYKSYFGPGIGPKHTSTPSGPGPGSPAQSGGGPSGGSSGGQKGGKGSRDERREETEERVRRQENQQSSGVKSADDVREEEKRRLMEKIRREKKKEEREDLIDEFD